MTLPCPACRRELPTEEGARTRCATCKTVHHSWCFSSFGCRGACNPIGLLGRLTGAPHLTATHWILTCLVGGPLIVGWAYFEDAAQLEERTGDVVLGGVLFVVGVVWAISRWLLRKLRGGPPQAQG